MVRSERLDARRLLGRDWRMAWLFVLPVLVLLIAYPFVNAVHAAQQAIEQTFKESGA